MSILRSEKISYKFMRIVKDQAPEILNEIGKMEDIVEFVDLNKKNPEAYKNYEPMIRRCEEIEKKINNFEIFSSKYGLYLTPFKSYSEFDMMYEDDMSRTLGRGMHYFDFIENVIQEDDRKLNELIRSTSQITDNLSTLMEKKNVYELCLKLIQDSTLVEDIDHDIEDSESLDNNNGRGFSFQYEGNDGGELGITSMNVISGVINTDERIRFKKMIFRMGKGRAMITYFDFPDYERYILNELNIFSSYETQIKDKTLQKVVKLKESMEMPNNNSLFSGKTIFVLFFPSSGDSILQSKMIRVCDMFNASRYKIPKSSSVMQLINELKREIDSNLTVFKETNNYIQNFIHERGGNSLIPSKYELYKMFIKKEKMIYTTLSKCIMRDHFIDAEIFVHSKMFDVLVTKLNGIYKNQDSKSLPVFEDINHEEKNIQLPTLIKTNDFTWIFQQIVNTYGIPRYGEINPALFNIVTFPFLFGVMFGDIGHGGLLLSFALFLVFSADNIKKNKGHPLILFLKAKYLLLFMGICSFYCGFIYNDFFSMPFPIFGNSCYNNYQETTDSGITRGIGVLKKDCVYPIGIDPKWHSSSNDLSFMNSFKMKISVVFGVSQMIMGIFIKGLNSIYFNNYLDFIFEFLPQLVFMTFLFGYMNLMIIIKWLTDWTQKTTSPPSIISQLLNVFLKGGSVDNQPLYGKEDGSSQESMHQFILVAALLCVPLMLLPKPIILYLRQHNENPFEDRRNLHIEEEKVRFLINIIFLGKSFFWPIIYTSNYRDN